MRKNIITDEEPGKVKRDDSYGQVEENRRFHDQFILLSLGRFFPSKRVDCESSSMMEAKLYIPARFSTGPVSGDSFAVSTSRGLVWIKRGS
jgi:hypothetical protein